MKTKVSPGGIGVSSPGYDRYQCEEDVRTLTRAAEVLGDRGRMRMAMRKFKHTQIGISRLVDVLARRKR